MGSVFLMQILISYYLPKTPMTHHTNQEHDTAHSQNKQAHSKVLIVSLLLISIITSIGSSIGSSYFFSKEISKNLRDTYLAIEHEKN